MNEVRLIEVPVYVGYYDIGGIRFMVTRTPSAFNRFMVRLVLGWLWVDL